MDPESRNVGPDALHFAVPFVTTKVSIKTLGDEATGGENNI